MTIVPILVKGLPFEGISVGQNLRILAAYQYTSKSPLHFLYMKQEYDVVYKYMYQNLETQTYHQPQLKGWID